MDFRTMSYGSSTYLINSTNGTATLTSNDGLNWTNHVAALNNGPEGQSSIYTNQFIVIKYLSPYQISHYGSLSPDGITRVFNNMTVNNGHGDYGWVYFISYDNATYIAGGGSNSPTILLSDNGVNWFAVNLPSNHGYGYSLGLAITK
jgi:hypothetical protein